MAQANVRGVTLNYEVVGNSGPWVALITGGRRGYPEFLPLARRIAESGYQVLLHDRRNTGASEILIAGEDGEEEIWADDLAALLQQLGADQAFIGGGSSGARTSMLVYLRHPRIVRGLLLMRVTGGAFAGVRLPENYYRVFIRAAQAGGMAAVVATEQYQERLANNPAGKAMLLSMDPAEYLRVMSHWLDIFLSGPVEPVMGITEEQLKSFKVPTIVIPGNDKVHNSHSGRAAAALIPGAKLVQLPIEDEDVPLIPFTQWGQHEPAIAAAFTQFMQEVVAGQHAR